MAEFDESVPAALADERLDRVVAMVADISRSEAARLVADGAVLVNGAVVTGRSARLAEGDRLQFDRTDPTEPTLTPDAGIDFAVVHEDTQLIVVDKPPGLVVHPGAGHRDGTLVNGLLARYPELEGVGQPERPGIVHRLDKGTSGLLVVARTPEAYEALVDAMAAHRVDRHYDTLVWGAVDGPDGVVDAPVGRSRRDPTRMAVTPRGRPARTHYRVEAVTDDPTCSRLTCRLETGRTHQIRVHLASIGHPVVADTAYRGRPLPGADLDRPWLHARTLRFAHPVSAETLEFSSPLPPDLTAALAVWPDQD